MVRSSFELRVSSCEFRVLLEGRGRETAMKRWCMFAAIFIGAVARAVAVELSASVDNNVISLDDRLILTVRVAEAMGAGEPVLPAMEGFRISNKSHSTQIQVVNAHLSMSGQYDYTLVPLKTGIMTIGPIALTHENRTYKTEPITVEVKENRAAISTAGPPEKKQEAGPARADAASGKKMFIELSADKTNVYLHEQVTLTFRFFFSGGLAEQPAYEPPAAPGFVVKPLIIGSLASFMMPSRSAPSAKILTLSV